MKTTIKKIADYWIKKQPYCETQLNFDWADAHTHCWNCGDDKITSTKKVRLERCHIIPKALDGPDIPENYMLLCKECHTTAPNSKNPDYMWEWILSNKNTYGFTGTYKINKALLLFKERTGRDFAIDVIPKINPIIFNTIILEELKDINTHGTVFNVETYLTLFREIERKYTK